MERDAGHRPVLTEAVARLLAPAGRAVLLDCTVGRGGHAERLLSQAGAQATLIGIDVDEENLLFARRRLERFGPRVRLFQANFREVFEVLRQANVDAVDALLADLGVASTHLDEPERGFSFAAEGPLDMRLDRRSETTAADLVNTQPERELADLIYRWGEERLSRRIARAIVRERAERPIRTTGRLAEICRRAYPPKARRGRIHPATRTFQALRIAVNDEIGALETLLGRLPDVLSGGGRAAIISFHSLEDRPVKRRFRDLAEAGQVRLLTRKPLRPDEEEVAANPRSRSARLRAIERTPDPESRP